jgi:hypothetical protein
MPDRDTCLLERNFKGETTAQKKSNQIVPPDAEKIGYFLLQLAVPVDPIFREIGAQVRARCSGSRLDVAWIGHLQQGTRLGVAVTEDEEVIR